MNTEPSKGRGTVTSRVCRSGLLHGLRRGGRRPHDRQQQYPGQGEESSRPDRHAHVSSAPFESRQPVDLLSAWYINTHERSVPVLRCQPRRGPVTVSHRYRAKPPPETDPPETERSNHSCPCTTSRGMPWPISYKTPSMVRAPCLLHRGGKIMSAATEATQGFATCRRS